MISRSIEYTLNGPQITWMTDEKCPNLYLLATKEAVARSSALESIRDIGIDRYIEIVSELTRSDHWLRAALVARPRQRTDRSASPIMTLKERRAEPAVRWLDRKSFSTLRKLNPQEFVARVYSERLGRGFTQADLRNVDPSLYTAIHRWMTEGNALTIELPTLAQWNTQQIENGMNFSGVKGLASAVYYRKNKLTPSP